MKKSACGAPPEVRPIEVSYETNGSKVALHARTEWDIGAIWLADVELHSLTPDLKIRRTSGPLAVTEMVTFDLRPAVPLWGVILSGGDVTAFGDLVALKVDLAESTDTPAALAALIADRVRIPGAPEWAAIWVDDLWVDAPDRSGAS